MMSSSMLDADKQLIEPDLNWGRQAKPQIEAAINRLLDRLVESPFRHRCEHSIHSDLIFELQQCKEIADPTIPLEQDHTTQLIHKEWPEPQPRAGKTRRGNIDVAVLTPLPEGFGPVSLKAFCDGWIKPYAAIELGLDYKHRHLGKDIDKLMENGIEATYVVHLSREHSAGQKQAADLIAKQETLRLAGQPRPATAAVILVGDQVWIKRPSASTWEVQRNGQEAAHVALTEFPAKVGSYAF